MSLGALQTHRKSFRTKHPAGDDPDITLKAQVHIEQQGKTLTAARHHGRRFTFTEQAGQSQQGLVFFRQAVVAYGVLASACKGVKLPAARAALQMPAPNLQALQCAQAFMARVARIDVGLCPCCAVGRLRVTRRCWRVLGACLGPPVHSCPSAGGRRDGLAQRDKSAAVCRAN